MKKRGVLNSILGSSFLLVFILTARTSQGEFSYYSDDDRFSDSLAARIDLGRRLFYDPILSRDSTHACASCHFPELAFTDGKRVSEGIRGRKVSRNSPTLTNVKDRKSFLLDGVNPSLESQVRVPIQEKNEFDFHPLLIIDRMMTRPEYVALSKRAYNREPDEYVITHAIAAFERTLVSESSAYDKYLRGDKEALTASQERGRNLFFETLYCTECHSGKNFSNEGMANNGLYEVYQDTGKMRLTNKEEDRSMFKVPVLRNIELTAPYMHNGSMKTLEEVVDHYASGGKDHPNKSSIIQPFELSDSEKQDLINFLKSLTDWDFVNNPNHRSPFE